MFSLFLVNAKQLRVKNYVLSGKTLHIRELSVSLWSATENVEKKKREGGCGGRAQDKTLLTLRSG